MGSNPSADNKLGSSINWRRYHAGCVLNIAFTSSVPETFDRHGFSHISYSTCQCVGSGSLTSYGLSCNLSSQMNVCVGGYREPVSLLFDPRACSYLEHFVQVMASLCRDVKLFSVSPLPSLIKKCHDKMGLHKS